MPRLRGTREEEGMSRLDLFVYILLTVGVVALATFLDAVIGLALR